MAAVSSVLATAAERKLMRLYFAYIEPLQVAARKRRCLDTFGIGRSADLGSAPLDLMLERPDCTPECQQIVARQRSYLAKYAFVPDRGTAEVSRFRGIPLLLELDRFPDSAHYLERLKGRSAEARAGCKPPPKGGPLGDITREIRKAGRAGFYCRRFSRNLYTLDRFAIETSKRYRSGGPVLAAFLRRAPQNTPEAAGGAASAPTQAVRCPIHWDVDWGVFTDDADAARPRLVGYIALRRSGNIVRLAELMGHAGYLKQGIMKLLFAEVVGWLLGRDDPVVEGISYLHYGAIEQGSRGLLAWKDRMQFEPFAFRWAEAVPPCADRRHGGAGADHTGDTRSQSSTKVW